MKNIIIPIVALLLIVGFGIFEVVTINNLYTDFQKKIEHMISLAQNQTLDTEQYQEFSDEWLRVRKKTELFLPHNDVYEMNLRVSETSEYVRQKDYELCLAHLSVMKDLAKYISHLAVPSIQHIM